MSVKILQPGMQPINIDGYLNLPQPGPEQPSAADFSFPTVRLAKAFGRIVKTETPIITLALRPEESAENFKIVAAPGGDCSKVIEFEDDSPLASATETIIRSSEVRLIQFDAEHDWITRNLNGRQNILDPLTIGLDLNN